MTLTKTLLAVDGNSLLHRSFHAMLASQLHTRDGRPTWAVKGFMSQLLGAIERVGADAVVVGFDDHTLSDRKVAHPYYKATRPPKPPELGQQIALTIELLRGAGIHVVVPGGLEADDILASAAATARAAGWRTVIVTSDRDSFALINDTTNVLRVINGGIEACPLLTPERLFSMVHVQPQQYRQYAAMRGDASDNLTGVHGIGEKTAARLLGAFGSVEAAFADLDSGGTRVATQIGKAVARKLTDPASREAFWCNVEIMTMHTDIPLGLGLADLGAGTLPLEWAPVAAALNSLELTSLHAWAMRVLTDTAPAPAARAIPAYADAPDYSGVPDAPEPPDDERELAAATPARTPARTLSAPAAPAAPRYEPDTLF